MEVKNQQVTEENHGREMIGVVVRRAAKSVALLKTNWHVASATLNTAINQTEQCTRNELEI
jgi:hypothetical protein